MLKYLLGCACAVAMIHAAAAQEVVPKCVTIRDFKPIATAQAAHYPGSAVLQMSGDNVGNLLAYINRQGKPTAYKGDELIIIVIGSMGAGIVNVMPFLDGCQNEKDGFSVSPVLFMMALKSLDNVEKTLPEGVVPM